MKNKFYALIIVVFTLFNFNSIYAQDSKFNIIGDWMTEDYWGSKSIMVFSEDNYLSLTIEGKLMDGKNFIIKGGKNDGKKGSLKFEVNFEVTPIEIYIIPILNNEEIEKSLFGYLEFIDDNKVLLKVDFDRNKKTELDENKEKERIMTLTRME